MVSEFCQPEDFEVASNYRSVANFALSAVSYINVYNFFICFSRHRLYLSVILEQVTY